MAAELSSWRSADTQSAAVGRNGTNITHVCLLLSSLAQGSGLLAGLLPKETAEMIAARAMLLSGKGDAARWSSVFQVSRPRSSVPQGLGGWDVRPCFRVDRTASGIHPLSSTGSRRRPAGAFCVNRAAVLPELQAGFHAWGPGEAACGRQELPQYPSQGLIGA